ncbi:MAG: leucine-rich repeat domain-containing protein, partial [Planctomycetes bacterium]|nr:leucine-rich repeat domain-containing protein [Planctomycetota bacterium]
MNMGAYGGTVEGSKSVAPLPTGSVGADEPVSFADENLKACVEDKLATFDPTPSDMLQLTGLNCRHSEIGDLTGLEYAPNLDTLTLSFNAIESISPLAGLSNLTSITINDNQISSISAV